MKTVIIIMSVLILTAAKLVESNFNKSSNQLLLKIHGRETNSEKEYYCSHFGPCVTAELFNPSENFQNFTLITGTFLQPMKRNIQRLMVTQNVNALIPPKQTKIVYIYAMCTQSFNSCPGPSTVFYINGIADTPLQKLSEIIEMNKYQNASGQNAVLSLINNSPQSNIYDEDTLITYTLRNYIAQARHENYLPTTAHPTYDANWFMPVSIQYKYFMMGDHSVTIRLYTVDSKLFATICNDSLIRRGNHSFEKKYIVPQQGNSSNLKGLKLLRWVDNTLVDIRYYSKADTSFTQM